MRLVRLLGVAYEVGPAHDVKEINDDKRMTEYGSMISSLRNALPDTTT